MSDAPFGKFFLPGPTEVRPEVLRAQLAPMIGHRGKGMEQLMARIQPGLQHVFRTKRPVLVASSSATGLMEAAIRNGARQRVLSLVNGAFSKRFFEIARACGVDAEALEVPAGQPHSPGQLEDALRGRDFDAVTVVHSETSTGVLNPIRELAQVAHARGDVALLVDSVTGIAAAPVETDEWALDFVLTGSQKAMALPPGLAFGVASEGLMERARSIPGKGLYFDLPEMEGWLAKNQTPNTPALSLLFALAVQLERIREEGIEARWARHAAMARRTWEWAEAWRARGQRMGILAPEGFRSPTVSCVLAPEGLTGSGIAAAMKERGFVIGAGYGSLKETTFRIGHMGDHTVGELDALLAELDGIIGGGSR